MALFCGWSFSKDGETLLAAFGVHEIYADVGWGLFVGGPWLDSCCHEATRTESERFIYGRGWDNVKWGEFVLHIEKRFGAGLKDGCAAVAIPTCDLCRFHSNITASKYNTFRFCTFRFETIPDFASTLKFRASKSDVRDAVSRQRGHRGCHTWSQSAKCEFEHELRSFIVNSLTGSRTPVSRALSLFPEGNPSERGKSW